MEQAWSSQQGEGEDEEGEGKRGDKDSHPFVENNFAVTPTKSDSHATSVVGAHTGADEVHGPDHSLERSEPIPIPQPMTLMPVTTGPSSESDTLSMDLLLLRLEEQNRKLIEDPKAVSYNHPLATPDTDASTPTTEDNRFNSLFSRLFSSPVTRTLSTSKIKEKSPKEKHIDRDDTTSDKENKGTLPMALSEEIDHHGSDQGDSEVHERDGDTTSKSDEMAFTADPEWAFWAEIVQGGPSMLKKKSRLVAEHVKFGIPDQLRGIVWQRLCNGKDQELEQRYRMLLEETTIAEKEITRDIDRTFPKHELFMREDRAGQQSLFNLMKAYAVYDTEVGYCQGLCFIGGILLMHMPEEEAFTVLVRLLEDYQMRSLYKPSMEGLHIRMYQLEALIQELLPSLHRHFAVYNVQTSMFASQWFIAVFATDYPLSMVVRIFDIVFAEGVESIFRFAIALLTRSQDILKGLGFEQMMDVLRHQLYELRFEDPLDLVNEAFKVKLNLKKLQKLEKEAIAQLEKNARETSEIEQLKQERREQDNRIRLLEQYVQEAQQKVESVTNELVDKKLELALAHEKNEDLRMKYLELQRLLDKEELAHELLVRQNKINELIQANFELEQELINTKLSYAESRTRQEEIVLELEQTRRKLIEARGLQTPITMGIPPSPSASSFVSLFHRTLTEDQ